MDWSPVGKAEKLGEGIVKLLLGQLPHVPESPIKLQVMKR
jgi:hypothetical protein